MAGTKGPILGQGNAKSDQEPYGLVQGLNGQNITQATISSVEYNVTRFEHDGSETVTGQGSLSVSSVVFDTPVTNDPRCTRVGGYNFLATIPASCFMTPDLEHIIRIYFYPVGGGQFTETWKFTPR